MFFNYEGQCIPQVTLQVFSKFSWYEFSTAELFDRKTIVAFAVLGAFARPYASIQLSSYNRQADAFRANGVDEVICVSANDPFSLASWAQEKGANRVRFLADMNGDFTREFGMMADFSNLGMGQRSWRYSMLVRDRLIEKMFVERDGFEMAPAVSNAETMLNYLSSGSEKSDRSAVLAHMWRTILSA